MASGSLGSVQFHSHYFILLYSLNYVCCWCGPASRHTHGIQKQTSHQVDDVRDADDDDRASTSISSSHQSYIIAMQHILYVFPNGTNRRIICSGMVVVCV